MKNKKTILVTGGAGFIGSAVIRHIIKSTEHIVVNVDKLSYSGNLQSLESIEANNNYIFEQVDICDENELLRVFKKNQYGQYLLRHIKSEKLNGNKQALLI